MKRKYLKLHIRILFPMVFSLPCQIRFIKSRVFWAILKYLPLQQRNTSNLDWISTVNNFSVCKLVIAGTQQNTNSIWLQRHLKITLFSVGLENDLQVLVSGKGHPKGLMIWYRVVTAAMLKAETMKQFCMKIDFIYERRENVLFLPSNMAAVKMLYKSILYSR